MLAQLDPEDSRSLQDKKLRFMVPIPLRALGKMMNLRLNTGEEQSCRVFQFPRTSDKQWVRVS